MTRYIPATIVVAAVLVIAGLTMRDMYRGRSPEAATQARMRTETITVEIEGQTITMAWFDEDTFAAYDTTARCIRVLRMEPDGVTGDLSNARSTNVSRVRVARGDDGVWRVAPR